ncbi:MAG: hypothetical protein ABJA90_11935 [Ginsengibacter sp.]
MKLTTIFLFLLLLLNFPVTSVEAQTVKQTMVKKTPPQYKIYKAPRSFPNSRDTTPKPPVQPETNPNHNEETTNDNNSNQGNGRYIIPDTIRPVPVETPTYVRSVLRLQKIYVNSDALELIQLLNPELANKQTVMSDYKLILPEFPEPDPRLNNQVNRQFRKDADPDGPTNEIFASAASRMDTLIGTFNSTNFEVSDVNDRRKYTFIKSKLPILADLNKRAVAKIKHTSKSTVETLAKETEALNTVVSKCNTTYEISGGDIAEIYSLMEDMNILLFSITGRKLSIPHISDDAWRSNKSSDYHLASYNIDPDGRKEFESILSDDDPRKFNIYVFRRSLVENGQHNPEAGAYKVSYAIPALAVDSEIGWTEIPEPASPVKCYFPPARFKFTITDRKTEDVYSATEDLYDAQKDPDQKWTIMNLLDRHPTYRLIFLIP